MELITALEKTWCVKCPRLGYEWQSATTCAKCVYMEAMTADQVTCLYSETIRYACSQPQNRKEVIL